MPTAAGKLEIRETTIDQFAAVGRVLFQGHALELGEERLDLNWAVFRALEDGGMLVPLGLWLGGHQLVGYCISVLTPDLLHSGETMCQNVATYLTPSHRNSQVVKLMLDSMELVGHARGAKTMLWSAPIDTPLEMILAHRDQTVRTEVQFKRSL